MGKSSVWKVARIATLSVAAVGAATLVCSCGSSNSTPKSPLSITTPSNLPRAMVNVPYTITLSVTGGVPPYAWNASSGDLPPGLNLTGTGILSGTPTESGMFAMTVSVGDSEHPAQMTSKKVSVSVSPALRITTTTLPNSSPGIAYSATLDAIGGIAPYFWMITKGSLPNGLTLDANSGAISGAPVAPGTSSFTVQVSDNETPAVVTAASLRIEIDPPPPRNAVLYSANEFGNPYAWQILGDGSLTLLPSSTEMGFNGGPLAASPTLPLLFSVCCSPEVVQSLLVNPDYSLTLNSSSSASVDIFGPLSVDPTGSNLYVPGYIDHGGTPGVIVLPGNGSLTIVSTTAVPNLSVFRATRIVFTPDASLAFMATCSEFAEGTIISFSRAPDGRLALLNTYPLGVIGCAGALAISPDGTFLAAAEGTALQIYKIGSDGSIVPVLPKPFTLTLDGYDVPMDDLAWDPSGSYLIAAASGGPVRPGGVAVVAFSGADLTLTSFVGGFGGDIGRLQQTGPFVYGVGSCSLHCFDLAVFGYKLTNGKLAAVPESPYDDNEALDIQIY